MLESVLLGKNSQSGIIANSSSRLVPRMCQCDQDAADQNATQGLKVIGWNLGLPVKQKPIQVLKWGSV